LKGCLKGGCLTMIVLGGLLFWLVSCWGSGDIAQTTRVLSPDHELAFVRTWEGGGGAAGWTRVTVTLEGKETYPATLKGYPQNIRWVSNSAVSFCPPGGNGYRQMINAITRSGGHREVTLFADCPAEQPALPSQPPSPK
jgi:hypothetical protein